MRILVTGGAGFIGSNFLSYMTHLYPTYEFINIDNMTYCGNARNTRDVSILTNYSFVQGDITDATAVHEILGRGVDVVVNFAAESHVDRSIVNPMQFVKTNVVGTQVLLEAARKHGVWKFVQVSTDEVYGTLDACAVSTEESPLRPSSPYSASKASADLLVLSYHHTYGVPITITRCSNNYGPHQFPEKLIPLTIMRALENKRVPIYGDGLQVRDWLHVQDHCAAIDRVIQRGRVGEVYNIGGMCETKNLDLVRIILGHLGRSEALLEFVEDRPGHDRRYALDSTKIRDELDWTPAIHFSNGIRQTVDWYVKNQDWWTIP